MAATAQTMVVQLFVNGRWYDAADLCFTGDGLDGKVSLAYTSDFIQAVPAFGKRDQWACTLNAEVTLVPTEYSHWPALLDDLLPAGRSRLWWLKHLGIAWESEFNQNMGLLKHACIAPIGHLRIKQAIDQRSLQANDRRFPIQDVIAMQYEFLEYANTQGAAIGGATGAGGVAPKLLLMLEHDQVFIDADFAGKPLSATPYLVKFARNTRSPRDNQVLKAEGIYYQVLATALADLPISTINTQHLRIEEHEGQISLWLPRFDVAIEDGKAKRIGVESIYSIIDAGPGSAQNHFDVIERLWRRLSLVSKMTTVEFVQEYAARDLLNIVFGNSDNHGRNTAFLKLPDDVRFAPIYDFAPMKADPEIVTRLFKWGDNCEQAGDVDFVQVAKRLSHFCPPAQLLEFLQTLAKKLVAVPQLLLQHGCPPEILQFPAIGFDFLAQRLQKMGIYHA
jgi:serine/threonine-protein kinase HipA